MTKIDSPEEMWSMVITCLKTAVEASTWAMWRERFNTNHPDHVRQQEIENPERYAAANWFAAKHLYCANKDLLDDYCDDIVAGTIPVRPGMTREVETFQALQQVVKDEMAAEMEKILTEENMLEKPTKQPNTNQIDDLDEDEIYARETVGTIDQDEEEFEGEWDGDDYVPLLDEEFDQN